MLLESASFTKIQKKLFLFVRGKIYSLRITEKTKKVTDISHHIFIMKLMTFKEKWHYSIYIHSDVGHLTIHTKQQNRGIKGDSFRIFNEKPIWMFHGYNRIVFFFIHTCALCIFVLTSLICLNKTEICKAEVELLSK